MVTLLDSIVAHVVGREPIASAVPRKLSDGGGRMCPEGY
jgi:hypothetical protein